MLFKQGKERKMTALDTLGNSIFGGSMLVLSNVVMVPAIIVALWFRDLITATLLFLMFVVSSFYHICAADWYCAASHTAHQTADHIMVYTTIFWIFLMFTTRYVKVQVSLLLINIAALVVFAALSRETNLFAVFYVVYFPIWVGVRWMGFGLPPRKYDLIFLAVAVALFGAGYGLYFAGNSPEDPNYWWVHSVWHGLSMTAVVVVLFAVYGYGLSDIFPGADYNIMSRKTRTRKSHKEKGPYSVHWNGKDWGMGKPAYET